MVQPAMLSKKQNRLSFGKIVVQDAVKTKKNLCTARLDIKISCIKAKMPVPFTFNNERKKKKNILCDILEKLEIKKGNKCFSVTSSFPSHLSLLNLNMLIHIFGYYRDDAFFCKAYQRRRGILDIYKAKPKHNSIDHS